MSNRITPEQRAHIKFLEQDGRLTPDVILADAKRKDSPLHDLFEWDKGKAAEQHWLDRAREIIRTVKLVVHTEFITARVPAYVRDPSAPPNEQGYIATTSLQGDRDASRRALLSEMDRLAGNLKRARTLASALDIEDVFEEMLNRLTHVRSQVQNQHIPVEETPQHVS